MVRPILVKMNTAMIGQKMRTETNEPDSREPPAIPPTTAESSIKSKKSSASPLDKSTDDHPIPTIGTKRSTPSAPVLIHECDEQQFNPRDMFRNSRAIMKSPQLMRGADLRTLEGDTARAMTTLREYSNKYDVGPRVVSENAPDVLADQETRKTTNVKSNQLELVKSNPDIHEAEIHTVEKRETRKVAVVHPGPRAIERDPNLRPTEKKVAPHAKRPFGQKIDFLQAARMNRLSQVVNNQRAAALNPWSTPEVSSTAFGAYMKSIHEQALRRNPAILHREQDMFLKQAITQQQIMNRQISTASMASNSNSLIGYNLSNQHQPNFNQGNNAFPPQQVPTVKKDINENSVNAMDYIAKLGKNKRGRPKRNPAEGWPKRPLSAYNIFFKECREKIVGEDNLDPPTDSEQKEDPNLKPHSRRKRRKKHGKISFGGLAKSVGSMWKELSPEALAYYERKAEESREAYRKEIKLFLEKRNAAKKEDSS